MHERYEKKKRHGKQKRGKTCLNPGRHTERGCNEASADEVYPKMMVRDPRRHDGRNSVGKREVFGAEGCDGCRIEKRTKENQLVESSCFLPTPTKKNRGQPDCKNYSTIKVRPDHLAGNCRGSHDCLSPQN